MTINRSDTLRNRFSVVAATLLIAVTTSTAGVCQDKASDILIPRHADWAFLTGGYVPPPGWNRTAFDTSDWKTGVAGFGYGDADDRTTLSRMEDNFTSVYIRRRFEVDDPDSMQTLYLHMNYDDGFIAWLNGHRVAASHAKRKGNRVQVTLHEAGQFETFSIKNASTLLKAGTNVLAIEGHNANISSSDFSLDPLLSTSAATPTEPPFRTAALLADLEEFERRVNDQSSYLTLRDINFSKAIEEIRQSITDKTTLTQFALSLHRVVMQLGDCHANVKGNFQYRLHGHLPFRPADTARGLAALSITRDKPLDPGFPYIEQLDGIPIDRWLTHAEQYVPYGSPQLRRRRSIEKLRLFDMFRDELQIPRSPTVVATLRNENATERRRMLLRLTQQQFSVASLDIERSRMLNHQIAYLRIPAMDSRLTESLVRQVREFRDTKAMIIDVRDNGGGTQHILRALYPFFRPADAESYVTNIAAYRLSDRFRRDHIEYRPTYRLSWEGWNEEERAAIRKARSLFQPRWTPPRGQFSEWHYFVLNRQRTGRRTADDQEYFFYNKPIAVLCNSASFSATDGFLSAFADLPKVTIIGEPSGGGSGARRRFVLPETGLEITVSSMASFRANGKLFEGNGVEVDIPLRPMLTDFTAKTDSVLQAAVELLRSKTTDKSR